MTQSKFHFTRQLVVRLRAAFMVFLLISACAGYVVWEEMRRISDRTEEIIAHSAPLMQVTHEIAVLLTAELARAARLKDATDGAELEVVQGEFSIIDRDLDSRIADLVALSPGGAADFIAAKDKLREATGALVAAERRKQAILAHRASLLSQLERKVDTMSDAVQGLRLDSTFDLQSALGSETTELTQALLFRIDSLNALAVRIDALPKIARGLYGTVTRGAEAASESSDLTFAVRTIARSVTRLDRGSDRADTLLAQTIEIRRLVIQPNGLIDTARKLEQNRLDLSARFTRHSAAVDGINAAMSLALANARQDMAAAGRTLEATVTFAKLAIRLSTLALAVIIGAIVAIIIERQLNGRIRSLIRSIRAIAEGDFERPVDVSGPDELGEIADAIRDLKRRSRELVRSNADLQSFAYAASHDLRSPMKAISDLAEWTLEDARDELSEENIDKLELLRNRTLRLTTLLGDLLSYARVDGEGSELSPVDIEDEARIIADLIDPKGRYPLTVSGVAGPVRTLAVPLRQILHNLVSNAVKHHDRPEGRIEVTVGRCRDQLQISVTDDGPGIPLEYQERVFELFQKLESRDSVEGSGVGLALIRKLVLRYGGDISVTSDPDRGRGTTFTLSLPADLPETGSIAV